MCAWSVPRTWSTGDTLTASLMNDNSNQLTALHEGASGISSLTTGDVITASSGSQLTRQATLNVSQGGTGAATHTTGNTLVGAGTGAITSVATLGVDKGGTGAATFTDGGLLLGSGTNAITALGAAANGQIPIGDGATDPVLNEIDGTTNEIEVTNGAGTIQVGIVSSPTLDGTNITGIPAAGIGSGTLSVARGGTGAATHTNGNYLKGAGTGAITSATASATFADVSPLTTRGDILYSSSGTVTGARLGVGGAGEVLTSDGTDVAWAAAGGGGLKGCRVYNSATQTISSASVTELLWNSETFDSDAFHSTASATGRLTIPSGEDGKYLIIAQCNFQPRNSGNFQIIVRKNGSDAAWGGFDNPNDGEHVTITDVMDLAEADYIQMFIYQNSGSTVDVYFHSTASGGMNSPSNFGLTKLF